jgi:hypothetical protein
MIYTGYYAKLSKYREAGLEPVAISGKVPDFYEGLTYPDFAPRWETFKKWKNGEIGNSRYTQMYKFHLDTLDNNEIKGDFGPYNVEGNDIVFLCYEKSGEFCHRHALADWLEENFGWKIEEYKG